MKERHENDAALQQFEAALRLKPDDVDARYNRAILLRQKGDKEFANRELSQLAGLSELRQALSQAKLLTTSASEQMKKHEPDAALVGARAALQLLKGNPLAFYLMGVAWE